jgi:hypothetical protein
MKYTRFKDIPQLTKSGNYQVNVSWTFLEEQLAHYGERQMLDLDPDFQRGHVWDEIKQRRYVEFILRGGQSSRVLYFNCTSWGYGYDTPIQLVDGKQRLEAVRKFLKNELQAFGSYSREFTDNLRLVGPDFLFNVNNLKTRSEVLQWYLDLNDGGVVHSEAELAKVRTLLAKNQEY